MEMTKQNYTTMSGTWEPPQTEVFQLMDGWHAQWRGRTAPALFNSKGAAQAWIDCCEREGKFRA